MGGTISVTSHKQEGKPVHSHHTLPAGNRRMRSRNGTETSESPKRVPGTGGGRRSFCGQADGSMILDDIGATKRGGWTPVSAPFRKWKTPSGRHWMFDIAMIDWKMPGMDGIETARRIRRLVGPDTMIIMITAYDWRGIEEEARGGRNRLLHRQTVIPFDNLRYTFKTRQKGGRGTSHTRNADSGICTGGGPDPPLSKTMSSIRRSQRRFWR